MARQILLVLAVLLTTSPASAQPANSVQRDIAKLVTPDAIQTQAMVTLGGIAQWISVRGRHRQNPILLFLHGGPGFTVSPVSYRYMRDWEEYFTVVQWDQRGAGKTYAAGKPDPATMTVERMVTDAEELVAHLRATYGQDRIVLMAHSFGTVLGTRLAQRRPGWFHAYIGMGQFVNAAKSEKMGFEATLAAARASKNDKAVAELQAMAPFPDAANPARNVKNLPRERFWLATYGGYYRHGMGHNAQVAQFSPDYTSEELKLRDEAQAFSYTAMWDELARIDFTTNTQFQCPVVILQGRHDLGTSSVLAGEWFASLSAPSKEIAWFEDSAHMVYEEEPGKLLVSLVQKVLPLTRKAK